MDGKIDAFYGAEVVDGNGRAIGSLPHKTIVEVVESFGKPANRDGEWVMVDAGDVAGWVKAAQVQAPYHGGARPGAGRKRAASEPMQRMTVTLPASLAVKAQQLGNGNVSAGIRIMDANRERITAERDALAVELAGLRTVINAQIEREYDAEMGRIQEEL